MIEAWIGAIIVKVVEQYAENKSGKRHLQTGVGWEAWRETFRNVTVPDWPHLLSSLARFSDYSDTQPEMVAKMLSYVAMEDKYGEQVSLPPITPKIEITLEYLIERMHLMQRRMAEWMEALVHWNVHWMATTVPLAFGQTEEERELVSIGLIQAGFSGMSEQSKEWWRFRHDELARQFAGRPEWRLVGQAQSLDKFGALRRPVVDELTVHWWPLLTRYRWTDHDLRCLIRKVAPQPDVYPLCEDKEFADYRKVLGLIKGKKDRDKSSPDGKPPGWRVALAMIDRLSE